MTKPTIGLPVQPMFCTVVPGRSPEQKIHKTRGQANNALGALTHWGRTGQAYEWSLEENDWVLYAENTTKRDCVECGKTWDIYDGNRYFYGPKFLRIDYDGLKPLKVRDRKVVCWECAHVDEESPRLTCFKCGQSAVVKTYPGARGGLWYYHEASDADHSLDTRDRKVYTW